MLVAYGQRLGQMPVPRQRPGPGINPFPLRKAESPPPHPEVSVRPGSCRTPAASPVPAPAPPSGSCPAHHPQLLPRLRLLATTPAPSPTTSPASTRSCLGPGSCPAPPPTPRLAVPASEVKVKRPCLGSQTLESPKAQTTGRWKPSAAPKDMS